MDNNEIEQLRKLISSEISKQLEPIVKTLEDIKEEIEDFQLYLDDGKRISQEELMKEFNITQEDLDNAEDVEIELKETNSQNPINAIKNIIKKELSQVSYDTWIANCEGVIEENVLKWFCPNTFSQDIVDKRYLELILSSCKLLELNVKEVKILVAKNDNSNEKIKEILNKRSDMYERLGKI